MISTILLGIPGGTVLSGILFLSLVVVLYLVAKAIMRWLEHHKGDNGN